MNEQDQQQPPINGAAPEAQSEIRAGQTVILDPQACENLENCALAAQASLIDLMALMPKGAEHMPLHVVLKVIAELTYVYWPHAGPKVWDDGVRDAINRMGQFTMMSPEAVYNWKKQAEERVIKAREERGEAPTIILPGGGRRL